MSISAFLRRELTGRKLVWNVSFYGIHLGVFILGWYLQESNQALATLNGLGYSVWTSRGAGLVLGMDGVLRNLICVLKPSLGRILPLDENLYAHRQIAYATLFFTIVHVTAHYVNFINVERTQVRPNTAWGIHYTEPGGFTGHIMLFIMLLMYTTAHKKIRAQSFETFWYTHHLAFFWLLGLYTHATGCFVRGALPGQPVECHGYETWRVTIWGGLLYFFERVLRVVRSRRETKLVGVLMHPSGAMEIRFSKPSFKYRAGQWLFLNVPEVSPWQWHPFTISSAPDDPFVSCHIRQAGDWTIALGERLGCTRALAKELTDSVSKNDEKTDDADFMDVTDVTRSLPAIRVDGPFGAPAEDVFKYEVAVLIGTGIGVTPFASILKNIWYQQKKGKLGALRRVEFIWINRETSAFEWFNSLLKELEMNQSDPNFLRINIYLTQKLNQDQLYNISLNDDEYDAITSLRTRTTFGRPQWSRVFSDLRQGIETGSMLPGSDRPMNTNVGVFYCGPNALARPLKEHCRTASSSSTKFTFKKEHF